MTWSGADFALLRTFHLLFEGKRYLHRNSSLGDLVACQLYEDLAALGRSDRFLQRVRNRERVVNTANVPVGKKMRRGDGTFGEIVPTAVAMNADGYVVARGQVATLEIGTETKILAKAMIKQIDRVIGDLQRQAQEFKRIGGNPICVAVVGINQAPSCTSYEGDRLWPTDGRKHKHPAQEAQETERRIIERVKPLFDELQILRFRATNVEPYPFEWVDLEATAGEYSSLLVRVSREYDRRFP
jgi:hypothetical protein